MDQHESKSPRRSFLKMLAVASAGVFGSTVIARASPAASIAAGAKPMVPQSRAGTYLGTGSAIHVATGLRGLQSVRILNLPTSGCTNSAYTTEAMQRVEPTAFLNRDRKDHGISFSGGSFVAASQDFTMLGETYYWEATGY